MHRPASCLHELQALYATHRAESCIAFTTSKEEERRKHPSRIYTDLHVLLPHRCMLYRLDLFIIPVITLWYSRHHLDCWNLHCTLLNSPKFRWMCGIVYRLRTVSWRICNWKELMHMDLIPGSAQTSRSSGSAKRYQLSLSLHLVDQTLSEQHYRVPTNWKKLVQRPRAGMVAC